MNTTVSGNRFQRHGLLLTILGVEFSENTLAGQPIYYYFNQSNVVVPGDAGQVLAFNCSNLSMENGVSLTQTRHYFRYCDNLSIRNWSFSGPESRLILDACTDALVQDCLFNRTTLLSSQVQRCKLVNNHFVNVKDRSVEVANSQKVNITGNHIQGNGTETLVYIHGSGNCLLANNKLLNGSYGILLSDTWNTSITRNEITGNLVGIGMNQDVGNISVYLNNIHNNSLQGADVDKDSGEAILLERNWWGDPSGPYKGNSNPEGKGDNVTGANSYSPWLIDPANAGPNATDDGPEPANSDSLKNEKDDETLLSPGVTLFLILIVLLLALMVVAVRLPSPTANQVPGAVGEKQKEKRGEEHREPEPESLPRPKTVNACPNCNENFEIGNPTRPLKLNCPFCHQELELK
jgi:parallel beta-helix repeat protein